MWAALSVGLLTRRCAQVMGVWPHYAMLNHSCTPNSVSYSHQGMLVTRASRQSISKGAEITTNYIGDLLQRYGANADGVQGGWGTVSVGILLACDSAA